MLDRLEVFNGLLDEPAVVQVVEVEVQGEEDRGEKV